MNVAARLVLRGTSGGRLRHSTDENGKRHIEHTLVAVYLTMLLQVMRDFPSLGDFRQLEMNEIRVLYRALTPELKKALEGK